MTSELNERLSFRIERIILRISFPHPPAPTRLFLLRFLQFDFRVCVWTTNFQSCKRSRSVSVTFNQEVGDIGANCRAISRKRSTNTDSCVYTLWLRFFRYWIIWRKKERERERTYRYREDARDFKCAGTKSRGVNSGESWRTNQLRRAESGEMPWKWLVKRPNHVRTYKPWWFLSSSLR